MKNPWRFFFIVEGILFLAALWQLSHNWPLPTHYIGASLTKTSLV